ncbi:hypothetical protein D5086_029466 [Populus alba]|uniref:Uncharacterized protein n=1 Tax=Populus alba TaxID=43335 RepID=A0ACC4ATR8_POPAL
MLVPPWLESLLSTSFFTVCRTHGDESRNECNMYCLDCEGDAFCFYCRSSRHKDHQVIQIRRSSYHDVVRVAEIQKVLDISGVQTYVINIARVLFLNERPTAKIWKRSCSYLCNLWKKPFGPFSLLFIRMQGVKRNGDASFIIKAKNEALMERREGISRGEEELREGSQQDIYPPTPPPPSSSGRRRKGIPHKAPFGS